MIRALVAFGAGIVVGTSVAIALILGPVPVGERVDG